MVYIYNHYMSGEQFNPTESLGYLVYNVSRLLVTHLQRDFNRQGYDATPEQWKVLARLAEDDGPSQQELADRLHKDKTSLTRLLGGLERRGLVTRKADPADRRSRRVYATDKGRKMHAALVGVARQVLARAQAGVDEEDLATCKDVLRAVFANLERLE